MSAIAPSRSGGLPVTGTGPAAPGLARLTGIELRKTADTRAGRWLLVVTGAAAGVAAVLQLLFAEEGSRTMTGYLTVSQVPASLLLPVLGILLVTSEWSQRTALTTFTLVPQRSRVLTAKVLAAAALGVLGTAASAGAAVLATLLTPALTDGDASWQVAWTHVGQVLLVQVAVVLVGVAFGLALLSSPLAIVLWFVLPTAVTVLVTIVSSLRWVRDWLDLNSTTLPMYEGRLEGQGWLQVATSVVLWGVVPMVIGWVRVSRQDVA